MKSPSSQCRWQPASPDVSPRAQSWKGIPSAMASGSETGFVWRIPSDPFRTFRKGTGNVQMHNVRFVRRDCYFWWRSNFLENPAAGPLTCLGKQLVMHPFAPVRWPRNS